ncbi:MAG: hypothetical protein L0L52_09080, partial [Staphylococcus equorum]|nr:hypothetical protein [Staphylococcus equorum]
YNKMLEERNSLIDDLSWYRAKVSRLERENEEFKESHIKHITNMENYYKDRVQELKEKNGELQEVIEGKNSDLLFTEDENKQLKESRDWDYEYIIKVNEENKRLKREKEEFQRKLMAQLEVNTELRMSNKDKDAILSEISQHIGNKPSSSTYKYFRAKLDGIGTKEGDQ